MSTLYTVNFELTTSSLLNLQLSYHYCLDYKLLHFRSQNFDAFGQLSIRARRFLSFFKYIYKTVTFKAKRLFFGPHRPRVSVIYILKSGMFRLTEKSFKTKPSRKRFSRARSAASRPIKKTFLSLLYSHLSCWFHFNLPYNAA